MISQQVLIYILIAVGVLVLVYGLCQLNPVTKKYAGVIAISLTTVLMILIKVLNKNQVQEQVKSEVKPEKIESIETKVEPKIDVKVDHPKTELIVIPPSIVTIDVDYRLSKNFTFGMLVVTEHRDCVEKNFEEGKKFLDNMKFLCNTVLEPVIDLVGVVPHINSCFRCPELNALVGGSKTSQHMIAEAGDTVYKGLTLVEVFNKIAESRIPFSQMIYEFKTWIHLGMIDKINHPSKINQKLVAESVKIKQGESGYDSARPNKTKTQYRAVEKL